MVWCHYLPQCYSNAWKISEKQTFRLDKKTGQIKKVSLESFCAKENFFCFDDDDLEGLPVSLLQFSPSQNISVPSNLKHIHTSWLEKALGFYIEGPISLILSTIREKKSLKNVCEPDMLFLLQWMCWLFIANPESQAIEIINNTLGYNAYNESIKQFPKREQLSYYFYLRDELEPFFIKRKWVLQQINSSEGPILTNDRPVMIKGYSLFEKSHLANNTIYFPVSPDLLLIGLKNTEWGYTHLPQQSRKEAGVLITTLVFDQAHRFVFGTDFRPLQNLFDLYQQELDKVAMNDN